MTPTLTRTRAHGTASFIRVPMLRSHIEGSISLADLAESTSKRQRVADSDVSTRADSSQTPAAASSERPLHDAACAPAGASADTKQSKSLVQEMAAEIARIAQTRVVHVENVRFTCLSTSLQLVKTTCGLAWLLTIVSCLTTTFGSL